MNKHFFWKMVGVALLVAGCATPPQTVTPQEQLINARNFNPNHWRADGKIALHYPQCSRDRGCRKKADNASVDWEHKGQNETIVLLGPLGREHLRLGYADNNVHIWEKGREQVVSVDKLKQKIGVPLPITSLAKWVTTKQNPENFTAEGWDISVSGWNGAFYSRIKLTQKDYFLHLLIKNMHSY